MAKKNKNKIKNGGKGTNVGNILRNIKTNVKTTNIPGKNLPTFKQKLPQIKTAVKKNLPKIKNMAGLLGANALSSLTPLPKPVTSLVKTKTSSTNTSIQPKKKLTNLPYNPNGINMSVQPMYETSEFQTLNTPTGLNYTPDPLAGMNQTPANSETTPLIPSVGGNQSNYTPYVPTGGNQSNYTPMGEVLGESTTSGSGETSLNNRGVNNPTGQSLGNTDTARSSVSTGGLASGATPSSESSGGMFVNPDGAENPFGDFNYSMSAEERALEKARQDEADYYKKQSKERVDRDQIMRDTLRQFQGEIDAVNAVYSDKIKQAKIEGTDRLGSTRAENFNAGAQNSSFGNAATERAIDVVSGFVDLKL